MLKMELYVHCPEGNHLDRSRRDIMDYEILSKSPVQAIRIIYALEAEIGQHLIFPKTIKEDYTQKLIFEFTCKG